MRNNDEIIRQLLRILRSYKKQPEVLHDFLREMMPGEFYPEWKELFRLRFYFFERLRGNTCNLRFAFNHNYFLSLPPLNLKYDTEIH